MADIAVNNSSFRAVAVYAANDQVKRLSIFWQLWFFPVDSSSLVLVRDRNVILDHNINRGRGNGGRSLVNRSLF